MGARDSNPLFKRLPAEVVSRRAHKRQVATKPTKVAIDLENVFRKKPDGRAKWLAKALMQVQEGRLSPHTLYDIVAHRLFVKDLTEKAGRRMYRSLHANLGVFSSKQQKFVEKECALAQLFAATAWNGNPKDEFQDDEEEATAAVREDMMARCRAFVRERQHARGERDMDDGQLGEDISTGKVNENASTAVAIEVLQLNTAASGTHSGPVNLQVGIDALQSMASRGQVGVAALESMAHIAQHSRVQIAASEAALARAQDEGRFLRRKIAHKEKHKKTNENSISYKKGDRPASDIDRKDNRGKMQSKSRKHTKAEHDSHASSSLSIDSSSEAGTRKRSRSHRRWWRSRSRQRSVRCSDAKGVRKRVGRVLESSETSSPSNRRGILRRPRQTRSSSSSVYSEQRDKKRRRAAHR